MPEYVSKETAAQIAMSYAPPSDVDFDCWGRREKSWEYERCEKIAKAIQNASPPLMCGLSSAGSGLMTTTGNIARLETIFTALSAKTLL